MKTNEKSEQKFLSVEKIDLKSKPRSLRPMRSMVAVRSLKPKTGVASFIVKNEEMTQRN
jgi:hypothetical protein